MSGGWKGEVVVKAALKGWTLGERRADFTSLQMPTVVLKSTVSPDVKAATGGCMNGEEL